MTLKANTAPPGSMMGPQEVTSGAKVSAYLAASPERVWEALRNFDSRSTSDLLKVLYQERNRKLVYAIFGLPRIIRSMKAQIELQPDGPGTWFHWSVSFSTKPTMFARFLRPLMRAGIAHTLRDKVREFKRIVENEEASSRSLPV